MITYRTLSGERVQGVVWSPGPLPRSIWVLPRSGASAAEAVVVRLPSESYGKTAKIEVREMVETAWKHRDATKVGAWHQSWRLAARNAPALPAKDWEGLNFEVSH